MHYRLLLVFFISLSALRVCADSRDSVFYKADHPRIGYTGRVDFSRPGYPRFWSPGIYMTLHFEGTYCILLLNDEEKWGKSHNYIEIKVDDGPSRRIRTNGRENRIVLAEGLKKGKHRIVICKNTEANIGYLEPTGIICEKLLKQPPKPGRKIEFIGDSITCGMGIDEGEVPCGKGEWYDQHSAWYAYGPRTARALQAQWQLSSVSGIGLIHSCCNHKIVMPGVFDKVNMYDDSLRWDFSRYQPDVVTVCLGQNDGIQDSVAFCSAYVTFVQRLRGYYPKAQIVLLNSPMADARLNDVLVRYITAVKKALATEGDKQVAAFFFKKRYNMGCDAHPGREDHAEMSEQLTVFIRQLMRW